jgi:hypothetical protein
MAVAFGASQLAIPIGAPSQDASFESHWQDGRAEMAGYDLTISRYGQDREGTAVMIFVTEPFSESKRVKADDPSENPSDTFEAFKLNFVRDFQTGIYDYNTMTSVFTHSADFEPAKISFTSAEWCGHVYEEQLFYPNEVSHELFSYFEGESAETTLERPANSVAEDNLPILLRGLRGAYLEPGGSRRLTLLPGAIHRRLAHLPVNWTTAEITRASGLTEVTVPAGDFSCVAYTVQTADGRTGKYFIEDAYPHRIVRWSWTSSGGMAGEAGSLTGSERLAYWRLHDEGDERYLESIGVTP